MDATFFNMEKRISVLENTRLHVDGQMQFENATCGRGFFKIRRKKSVFKNTRLRVDVDDRQLGFLICVISLNFEKYCLKG